MDCGRLAAAAGIHGDTGQWFEYRRVRAKPGWCGGRCRHPACGWRKHGGTGADGRGVGGRPVIRLDGRDGGGKRHRAVDRGAASTETATPSACAIGSKRATVLAELET